MLSNNTENKELELKTGIIKPPSQFKQEVAEARQRTRKTR